MHEDMLFYRGECVTHWEFRFSGELVSFRKLGQFDLYIYCSKFLGSAYKFHMFYEISGCRVCPWISAEWNATLIGSI